MQEFVRQLGTTFLATILSSGVVAAILTILFRRTVIKIEEGVKNQFEVTRAIFTSTRLWKERSVSELLGPLYMQFDRTKRAFDRWVQGPNLYLEAKVIREGNMTIRDLLLTKSSLIPSELRDDAGRLIDHYDRWLEKYEEVRGKTNPALDQSFSREPFVFVGNFPRDAEIRFKATYHKMWAELYEVPPVEPPRRKT